MTAPSAAEPAKPPAPRRGFAGPLLVALGAGGWGTEGLWRQRLGQRLAPYPIVASVCTLKNRLSSKRPSGVPAAPASAPAPHSQ